jgi:hypothetical protein
MLGIGKLKAGDKLLFTGYKTERDNPGAIFTDYSWCDAINKRLTIGKEYPIVCVCMMILKNTGMKDLEQYVYDTQLFYEIIDDTGQHTELEGSATSIDIGFDRAWVPANISEDVFIKSILLHCSEEALVAWKSR